MKKRYTFFSVPKTTQNTNKQHIKQKTILQIQTHLIAHPHIILILKSTSSTIYGQLLEISGSRGAFVEQFSIY